MISRKPTALVAGLGVLVFAGLSVARWRAETRPTAAPDGLLGPTSRRMVVAADALVDEALGALHDRERPAAERLASHAAALEGAATLLERAVELQPGSSAALARLAVVRWELDHGQDPRGTVELIERAAAAMPRSAETHRRLGDVLIGIGEPRRGMAMLAKSLELAPATAPRVVERLVARLVPVEQVLGELPSSVPLLEALAQHASREGAGQAYLGAVENALDAETVTSSLLAAYSNTCLRERDPRRAIATLERLGRLATPRRESARVNEIARAWLRLGRPREALAAIEDAQKADAEWVVLRQRTAESFEQLDRWDEAMALYRDTLGALANVEGRRQLRARLYEGVGRVHEARGEAGRAFDAYRLAVELDPGLQHADRRLRQMRRAAGVGPVGNAPYSGRIVGEAVR